jgi:hypothetical protein
MEMPAGYKNPAGIFYYINKFACLTTVMSVFQILIRLFFTK